MINDEDSAWDDMHPSCPVCGDYIQSWQEYCSDDCAKNSAYLRDEEVEEDEDLTDDDEDGLN